MNFKDIWEYPDCYLKSKEKITNKTQYKIKRVIFNKPATIVFWANGDKTVVKCQKGEKYDKEKGLAMAVSKYIYGNKSNFNNIFEKFIGE